MAVTSGFFTSLNGDRKYSAEQLTELFDGFVTDGVMQTVGNVFDVKSLQVSSRVVTVDTGRAWFDNVWIKNDAKISIDIPIADVLLNRWDAVVIEVDKSINTRAATLKVVSGTPANDPVKPTMAHTEFVTQYPIAYVYCAAGTEFVTDADITQNVGTDSCPYAGLVNQSKWIEDEQALFDAFMADLHEQISEDTIAAYAAEAEMINEAIAVNMIPYPYANQSSTLNGVHWSVNADGSIAMYTDAGGSTEAFYGFLLGASGQVTIPDGDYIVHYGNAVSGVSLRVQAYTKDATPILDHIYGMTESNGGKFTKSDGDTYWTGIVIRINSGTIIPEAQPLVVYPMLEAGNLAHDYVRYIAPGKYINQVVLELSKRVPETVVNSVAGRTGAVTLTAADIGAGSFPSDVVAAGTTEYSTATVANLVTSTTAPTAGSASPYPNKTLLVVYKQ